MTNESDLGNDPNIPGIRRSFGPGRVSGGLGGVVTMMISTEAANDFLNLVRAHQDRFAKQVHDEVRKLERQAAAASALGNSRTAIAIQEACVSLMESRLQIIWENLLQASSAHGIVLKKDNVPAFFETFASPASETLHCVLTTFGNSAVFRSGLNDLRAPCSEAVREHHASEIGRLRAEASVLAARNALPEPARQAAITVTGSNNVINTGDRNWIAHSSRVDTGAAEALTAVLQGVLAELDKAPVIEAFDREELREIIRDSIREAQRAKPNGLKLKSSLRTIAEAVKLVPAMKDAYDTIAGFISGFDWKWLLPGN